jgi:hypothetical protein
MPEKVSIPISVFEYTADFVRPIVSIWMDRSNLVQAMFDALSRWKLDINDVEPITTGKPSEQGLKIKLTEKRCTVFFGVNSFKFTREDVSWDTAEETIEILDTARRTLAQVSGAEFAKQNAVIALHVQPRNVSFRDLLLPFLSPAVRGFREETPKTGALIVKWEDRRIVLDGSAALANGLYLRFERDFDSKTDYQSIAQELHQMEQSIFSLVDIEEDEG